MKDRSPAYLLVGKDGQLIRWGGDLSRYGIRDLQQGEPVAKQVLFTEGLLPLDDGPLFLSCVKAESGLSADIHLFPEDEEVWILLLDATEEEDQRSLLQQRTNELGLLQQRLSSIWRQPMEEDAAGELARHLFNVQPAGERREVTVLSADIRGFSTYSEDREPESIMEVLNRYLQTMIQPILDEGGVLDRIMGPQVMAIFGLPHTGDPAPDQATRAALRMLQSVKGLNRARRRDSEETLGIGIGIASGPAVLGMLQSNAHSTFSAIGATVDRAAGLEHEAHPLQILLDRNTFEKIEQRDLRKGFSRTTLKLQGVDKPVQAFSFIEEDNG